MPDLKPILEEKSYSLKSNLLRNWRKNKLKKFRGRENKLNLRKKKSRNRRRKGQKRKRKKEGNNLKENKGKRRKFLKELTQIY